MKVIGVIKLRKPGVTRREFLESAAAAGVLGLGAERPAAQVPGDRPPQALEVTVLNPATRVPVGLIIDDNHTDTTITSVLRKSSPLKRSGSPADCDKAYEKQSP